MLLPIAAIAVLGLMLLKSNLFAKLRSKVLPGVTEKAGSLAAVVASLVVLVHGNVWAALCLFGVGLWLLGRSSRRSGATAGGRTGLSRIRSAMIEMDFDQVGGTMVGRIIAGPHEGLELERLDRARCEGLWAECLTRDPDGARLLEAYFDRRFVRWRPAGHGHGDPGERRARGTIRMSEDEAYEVLGLRRGATRAEVVRSHRSVMKKWHPDQGGTAALAARANEAREVLLRRHA